jgi:arsenite-transporting ATPase
LLRDPELTDFRIVMVPEELSVAESTRLLAQLQEYGIPVNTIVVNRVLQDLAAVVDLGEDHDELTHVSPNHEECAFCARRWDVQQKALASAQDLFQGRAVKRVPLLAEEVRGERLLGVVAACLD